ncbi:MAG: 16S rRNA (cytosine(1402)-N(4))-methyltransferase RsmH [Casimicrobium sp.]
MQSQAHITVLLHEACDALLPERAGITLVDGTFGRGGHSRLLLSRMANDSRLIALDRDESAERVAREIDDKRFTFVRNNFGVLVEALASIDVHRIDGLLLDIGVSSPQLDDAERGFSFMRDGPLDMRMDQSRGTSAAEWLAHASAREIADVIHDYGEERFATRIATALIATRERQPIERTLQLAQIVEKAVPARSGKQHPATKTFQAIRIHVNGELEELRMALDQSLSVLNPAARLAVISFHSLEDRIVKQWMRDKAGKAPLDPRLLRLPQRAEDHVVAPLAIVGKDIEPSVEEVSVNPRARSARLRVAERTGARA